MRFLQILIRKLVAVAILLIGVALTTHHSSEIYQWMIQHVPSSVILRTGVALILIIVGLLALIPMLKFGRKSVIKFDAPNGSVTIQLDSVEAALNGVVSKMPEVKKLSTKVNSAVNGKKVSVIADVILYKDTDLGARETASIIRDYISETAISLLGMQELASVDVNVSISKRPIPGKAKLRRKEDVVKSMPGPVKATEEPKAEMNDEDYYLPVRNDVDEEGSLESVSLAEVETDEGFSPVTSDLLPSSPSTLDEEPEESMESEEEANIPDFTEDDSEDKHTGPGLEL